jgi:NhaA family Na+:H+ antiporter
MKQSLTAIFKDFTSSEKNAGLVLLLCLGISLIISNSTLGESYIHFWHQKIGFSLAGYDLSLSVEHWINDGLMTIFFLLVGLEIERELYAGELYPVKNALLPVFAALGGMLIPAAIYFLFNYGTFTANGFGIPMGTDIAFALGILALAGDRVPLSIKILLTAIAIIDDLGSILIIAFFYGSEIHYLYLAVALGIFALLLVFNRVGLSSLFLYLPLGIIMWFFMMQSGIHPTISGVLLAFALPFGKGNEASPSIKLQHALHLPVAFFILPVFTLANTAIPFNPESVSHITGPHSFGIAFGLFLGKPLGILAALFIITKLKLVQLPGSVTWYDLLALGFIAGIGFTMSIFITQLAFTENTLIQSSKLVILVTSGIAGCVGLLLFRLKKKSANTTELTP